MVARRLNVVGLDQGGDSFLAASYLAEAAIKSVGVVLVAGLQSVAPDQAYRAAYTLVRADGLGQWDTAIRDAGKIHAGFLPHELSTMREWATRRRTKAQDFWLRESLDSMNALFRRLGVRLSYGEHQRTALDLISALIAARNKTKAHGAVEPEFYAEATGSYVRAISSLIRNCPAFEWDWCNATRGRGDRPVMVQLRGESPRRMSEAEPGTELEAQLGVSFLPPDSKHWIPCSTLLKCDANCSKFYLPNGSYRRDGAAEFIDYASGHVKSVDCSTLLQPPARLPESETHGTSTLEVRSNALDNLPSERRGYIERPLLEEELELRLLDANHTIITLHGRGGIGKTWLALHMAQRLATSTDPPFEQIVWFSARDLDLRPTGPSPVQQDVVDLGAIATLYGRLLGGNASLETLAAALQTPDALSQTGTLFIFDNFETLADTTGIHKFLDTHTHIPNKVLITSRERAFKADFPIDVGGMEPSEAQRMVADAARELSIEGIVDDKAFHSIYAYTEGHPYAMRMLVGEIAKRRKLVPLPQLMTNRDDVLDAVFERSFDQLSDGGRRVFLTIANWRSTVSGLALTVVLGQHDLDVETGLDECLRLSLVAEQSRIGDSESYLAPQLARLFGQKKLTGDPDRLLIEDDLFVLQGFGDMELQERQGLTLEDQVARFVQWCFDSSQEAGPDLVARYNRDIELVAKQWPPAWLSLADFRYQHKLGKRQVELATRSAVEEMPFNTDAWRRRAFYARAAGDDSAEIAALISAVESSPDDTKLMTTTARRLVKYVRAC